jgi:prophage tail gpP-like protein
MSKIIVNNLTTGKELLWRTVKIRKSLDEICHSLELEIPPSERLKIKKHHRLEVFCKNKLINNPQGGLWVTTVLVDEITANADTGKNSFMVVGRSPARDIIDSAWSDTDEDSGIDHDEDQTLKQIIRQIGAKFNIGCDTFEHEGVADPTAIVHHFTFENESPWTKLIDEADQQGFVFTSNEVGNLYLWRVPGEDNITKPFYITEGINVKNIKWTENGSEQFHKYVVKGGGYEAEEIDNSCPGNRILTIVIDDLFVEDEKVKRRAITEMRRRSETKTIVTVSGWGLTDEQIRNMGNTNKREIYWVPNTLIPVKVPSLGLDANLLISEVEYTANAETISCDITLVKRGMYL